MPLQGPPLRRMRRLVGGAAAQEAEDDSGGDPIVVLMKIGAEGGPIVVGIEQTDVDAAGWVDIDSAAEFVGETVLGSGVFGAADGGGSVRTGAANQSFRKRG